jgi:DNA polymerase/3'-5' exonuclease PolX
MQLLIYQQKIISREEKVDATGFESETPEQTPNQSEEDIFSGPKIGYISPN